MIAFLSEPKQVRLGKIFKMSDWIIKRNDSFLQAYDRGLFCKWNTDFQVWEIWERGISGQEYKVKTCWTENYQFREIDASDIEDIHNRNIASNSLKGIFTESRDEDSYLDNELYHEKKQEHQVFDVSVETFNKVMGNPVIGGKRT